MTLMLVTMVSILIILHGNCIPFDENIMHSSHVRQVDTNEHSMPYVGQSRVEEIKPHNNELTNCAHNKAEEPFLERESNIIDEPKELVLKKAFSADPTIRERDKQNKTTENKHKFKSLISKKENSLSFSISARHRQNSHEDAESEISFQFDNRPKIKLNSVKYIDFFIRIIFVISGLYMTFSGFRFFLTTMTIICFVIPYYAILFIIQVFQIHFQDQIGLQIGFLFGCFIIGFGIFIACIISNKFNQITLGLSISTVISLFSAQFFTDFQTQTERMVFLGVYLTTTIAFALIAHSYKNGFSICGPSFFGAVMASVNLGIITNHLHSFEGGESDHDEAFKFWYIYFSLIVILTSSGILAQFLLRKNLLPSEESTDLEEHPGTSFLH